MKRSVLQDHSYLILNLAGMVKIEPLFLLFCYTEIFCLLRVYNLRSRMADRKLHPEHHSPRKTFLCIICLILIIKLGISMFPKLQSCQLSRRSVSDTQVFTPGCGPLQSPCSSRSFDAVSQSLFPTETHHV